MATTAPVINCDLSVNKSRSVNAHYLSVEQGEGRGARVRRSIGRAEVPGLDPFLMLDEFKGAKPVGFPDHPHRGFETISYLLEGEMEHHDFVGHKGRLGPGDLQIMTAGRGIVHCEMVTGDGVCRGLQLWVNLPAKLKMCEPAYQELTHDQVGRSVSKDGLIDATIISGVAYDGTRANSYTRVPTMYLAFTLKPGAVLRQPIPKDFNAFCYTLEGSGTFGATQKKIGAHYLIMLSDTKETERADDDHILVEAGSEGLHFVLVGGQPIGEPVVQYGPFVMNTQQEIMQAFSDYSSGRNGFENAHTWASGHA